MGQHLLGRDAFWKAIVEISLNWLQPWCLEVILKLSDFL